MKQHNFRILPGLLAVAAIVFTSCHQAKPVAAEKLQEITSPAGPDSAQPNLAVGPNGQAYLSWIETTESGSPALKFSIRKDDKWSAPQTIIENDELVVNYADFPSVLPMGGGVLAAHWMMSIPKSDGYNINVAFSHDDGRTWSKPVVPHRDRTPNEHGFVSLTPAPDGGIGAIWLDSRKLKGPDSGGDVAMMYTSISQDGKLGPEISIDNRVCECCQPSAVRVGNNLLAVYRDRSDKEIRDTAIVRFDGTKWSEPKTVFADMWKIYGCPINGPAISAHGNQVAVAWFTAPNDKPKVEMAFSVDGGINFGPPVQVDEGNPAGRVGIVVLDSGNAVVSWLERADKAHQLRARRIDKDGTLHPSLLIGTTESGTSGGFPRIGRDGDAVMFAWTDTKDSRVKVSVLNAQN